MICNLLCIVFNPITGGQRAVRKSGASSPPLNLQLWNLPFIFRFAQPQAASGLYAKAVQSLEAEGKAGMAAEIYRHATGNELRRGDWAAAAGFQLRWAVACDEAQASCCLEADIVCSDMRRWLLAAWR